METFTFRQEEQEGRDNVVEEIVADFKDFLSPRDPLLNGDYIILAGIIHKKFRQHKISYL
jgi:hypothetical protein